MTIDKSKLQPLLWAVVGAWKAGDQDLHLRTDALDAFLGEKTVEEVALGLLAEIDRLVPFEEAYATACSVRNRLIKEKDQLDQFIVANKVASDSFRAERDQLKAENEALRKVISQSAASCGAAVSVECTLEFMSILPAEIDSVLAALRKDAERYRWLRQSGQCDWDASFEKLEIRIKTPHFDCGDINACIDEAMGKEASHD